MAKEDFKLRDLTNPALTTKGSELTWDELDQNFVEMYNQLLLLSGSSFVAAYDAGVTYDNTNINYAMQTGQLWKFINGTPAMGVTPGTDPATWQMAYPSDLVHRMNRDQKLDEGGTNEVLASALKPIVSAFTGGAFIYTAKITMTDAEIKAGNSVTKDLISAINNNYIDILDVFVDWNLSVGLDVGNTLYIGFNGLSDYLFQLTDLNGVAARKRQRMTPIVKDGSDNSQYADSTKVIAKMDADSTTGTGSATIYINYVKRGI